MKKINLCIATLIMLALAWSCEENENLDPVGNWEIAAPVLSSPADNATVVLDENAATSPVNFEWAPATTTNRFGVDYTFLLVPEGSEDFENPLLRIIPANAGRETAVSPTAAEIDYMLWAACYPAGSAVALQWVVIARAIDKETISKQNISVTRFETDHIPSTLYLYGSGTESGEDAANASPMRPVLDNEGNPTGIFEVYTSLTAGGTYSFRDQATTQSRPYGGADGVLEGCGPAIAAPETGQYRVTVNLTENTYELLKIDRWSLVGDAVEGGWGGDVPLTYKGNGIWESEIEFYQPYEGAGFIFRANGDWGYLFKRVQGTAPADNKGGDVVMESQAGDILFEDMPGTLGLHKVTLDLSADGYTYSLVEIEGEGPVSTVIGESNNPDADAVSGSFDVADMDTPDQVFLLSDGTMVAELTKNGDAFSSEIYLALEASKTYSLNTASDGSGDEVVTGDISVARDQAYRINIDFATGKLSWKYYNMKLFHWDEVGGGWDARQELLMTYIHPYTYEVTGTLSAGFHSKFNSPWEVELGTDDTALSGTMTHGGPNYKGITQNGTYEATIVVSEDYSSADYTFVKQ
jgi:hypothetical protein